MLPVLMRIAALYDIHGNLPALEAVLREVEAAAVDRIVVGGDVVPGPMARESLDRLAGLSTPVDPLRGNGESAVLDHRAGRSLSNLPAPAREAVAWSADQLGADGERRIARWPATLRLSVAGWGEVLFCHATPRSDTEIFTRRTPEERLVSVFSGLGVSLVVCGHTHMPFEREIGGVRVVNAGSVGMPFGATGAFWLLLAPEVEPRRTAYDLPGAADRIRATEYPQAGSFASGSVLAPPSEAEMLEIYSRVELSG